MNQAFERIFIIMLENENASTVMQNDYFAGLARRGTRLTNYHGVTHPSQPNYLATIAGDFFGWDDDNCKDFDKTNLVDLLEAKGVSWMVFVQDLPAPPNQPASKLACIGPNIQGPPLPGQPLYYRKHNPFVSFVGNQTPERLSHIVEAHTLYGGLPPFVPSQFMWYAPNIANCGHTVPTSPSAGGSSVNVNYSAVWLQSFLEPLLLNRSFMQGTLVVLTYDEDWPQVDDGQPETGEPIYTVLLGDMIAPGAIDPAPYTHYNLLATIEHNFDLGNLGRNDAAAAPFHCTALAAGTHTLGREGQ